VAAAIADGFRAANSSCGGAPMAASTARFGQMGVALISWFGSLVKATCYRNILLGAVEGDPAFGGTELPGAACRLHWCTALFTGAIFDSSPSGCSLCVPFSAPCNVISPFKFYTLIETSITTKYTPRGGYFFTISTPPWHTTGVPPADATK
jgi:hypothetical protein